MTVIYKYTAASGDLVEIERLSSDFEIGVRPAGRPWAFGTLVHLPPAEARKLAHAILAATDPAPPTVVSFPAKGPRFVAVEGVKLGTRAHPVMLDTQTGIGYPYLLPATARRYAAAANRAGHEADGAAGNHEWGTAALRALAEQQQAAA